MGLTLLYDVIKSELSGATKRSIIEDYDTVLSLDLLKPVEEEAVDDELKSFVEMKIAERAEAKKA